MSDSSFSSSRSRRGAGRCHLVAMWGLLAWIILLAALPASAQRLTLLSIDSSGFPLIRAKFYALDPSGAPLAGLSKESVTVTENGARRQVVSLSCPSSSPHMALSSVLAIDVSGSMSYGGDGKGRADSNILLARAAAFAWIDGLPSGESQCAITSFDDRSLMVQDFTGDRDRLRAAVAALKPSGGTSYNAGLIDPSAGALTIAESGTARRIVIFLTDGRGEGNQKGILAAAERAGAIIYCVTLNMPAPPVLKAIAAGSGGACFENVTSVEEARSVYQAILHAAQGGEPCELAWNSDPGCTPERAGTIAISGAAPGMPFRYAAPESLMALLELDPPALRFGMVRPGESRQMRMTLTARNAPVTVTGIERLGRETPVFALEGTPVPFTLAPGESRSVSVRYLPADTNYAFARWGIRADACTGTAIFATGGSSQVGSPTVRLLAPNGGERFRAGDDAMVSWEGIPAPDTVRLDYSTDNGANWRTIANRASGLAYRWKVPATPSERCLARVTPIASGSGQETPVRSFQGHDDYVLSFNFSPDGSRLVTASWDGGVRIWDVASGRTIRTLAAASGPRGTWQKRVYYAEFSPDGSRILTSADGDRMQIWDAESGRPLHSMSGHLYSKTDVAYTITDGNSGPEPVFSADGSRVLMISDKLPAVWDVSSGRMLYQLRGHGGWVNLTLFSPDGRRLVTVSHDSTARIWDAATGRELRRLSGHNDDVVTAAFSPDSRLVATVGRGGDVRIWDAATGEQIRRIQAVTRGMSATARVLFSPDGISLLVWAGIEMVPMLYDLRTGAPLQELAERIDGRPFTTMTVTFATFSADGSRVAIVNGDRVEIWDVTVGERIGVFPWNSQMSWVVFSPDGERIVTAMEHTAALWDVGGRGLQSDRSDDLWAIVADSRPSATDIDFGERPLRSITDSTVAGYIRNDGTGVLRVHAITIDGPEEKDFTLVSGLPPFDVPPGDRRAVEFRFAPGGSGPRQASVRIDAGGTRLRYAIRGEGVQPKLRLEAERVDLGDVRVGERRDSTVRVLLRNNGSSPVVVSSATLIGPDTTQLSIVGDTGGFTVPARSAQPMTFRFAPERGGRTSSRLSLVVDGSATPLVAQVHGLGVGGDETPAGLPATLYTDPTTFRGIALPNAIVPPKGTIVTGIYDLFGVMAGYVPADNVMILAGGAVPFPDDWGGVKGTMYGAYSLGARWTASPMVRLNVALGYQWARSVYDEEGTADLLESRITVNAPYASVSYGDSDSRISATFGYAFKRHVTPAATFSRDAMILGISGDYRFANRWKVAAEALTMQTLGYMPVALTFRFFGERYAVDAGVGYLGLETPGGAAPSAPLVPLVSYVAVW